MPDAYQRLLLDAINGDASLFARSDEVEASWGIVDPIQAAWTSTASPHLDGPCDPVRLPSQAVKPENGEVCWLVDFSPS